MRRTVRSYWIFVLLVGCAVSVWAQQSLGSFTGTVTDTTGALVPGATVTALEMDKGFARTTVTAADGSYMIPDFSPGRYELSVKKEGFKEYAEKDLTLTVDAHISRNFQLEVGSVATVDYVEGRPELASTENATVGTTVEQEKISELPYNGRHFLETMLFTPGVVPGVQGSELNNNRGGSIEVNGMREDANSYLLDGMSDTSIAVGTYSATPPLDSIQEFQIETGVYDAKFGNSAGGQVNMVTKSGTNTFHGSLYEYLRNNKLDSRNFFEPEVPPFHRNQYGASAGGPLSMPGVYNGHDRTFYFMNFEGLRDNHSFFSRSHVPTLAERGGDFADLLDPSCPNTTLLLDPLVLFNPSAPLVIPGGPGEPANNLNTLASSLPSGTLDPVGSALEQLYPKPNIANAPCGQENYQAQVQRFIDTNSYVGRFDHGWGDNDKLLFRYNLTTDSELSPSGLPTGVPGYGIRRVDWFNASGLNWTHAFSPTLLNVAKVAYNRWQYRWSNQDQGLNYSNLFGLAGAPQALRDTGVPNLGFAGYDGISPDTSVPQAGAVNTFQYADTLTLVRGSHTWYFGADIRPIRRGNFFEDIRARDEYDFNGVVTGSAIFGALPTSVQAQLLAACPPASCSFGNGVADALFGIPTAWVRGSSGYISGTGTEYDYFAQDTWKARRNLTVTLGLRYEFNSLVTDKYDHLGGFDFNTNVCGSPGAVLVAGKRAATLDCFQGTTVTAAGAPVGTFLPMGTINLGGTSENRALQRPDRNNFGPRIGLAWLPFGDKRTVIRSGFGVYYDQQVGELYFQKSFNPPFFELSEGNLLDNETAVFTALETPPSSGGLPLGTGLFLQNLFVSSSLTGALFPTLNPVIIDEKDGKVLQWTFNVQRQLGDTWLLDVGYVGTRGLELPLEWDANQPNNALYAGGPTCISGMSADTPCPRPYPNYQTMSYTDSIGTSIYHSLQAKIERHYASGLAVLGAYTWSKSVDTNSTYFGTDASSAFPENSYNRSAEKGRSDFDFTQRFSLAYIYDLPFKANQFIKGWEAAGIVILQTGAPYTPTVSGNPSNNIDGNDRPNVVPGVPFYPSHKSVEQWTNPAAFSVPAAYTFGNAGRNILTGPGVGDWDFSLLRNFKIGESKNLQFRAEMFNIFNTSNFALPNGSANCSCFGVIGNTVQPIAGQASGGPGDPREIQFAMRFTW